ncbi:MAG: hypothetical protein LBB48_04975 [Treponema sp.]|jgi:hypothetical protein|nr:hypothetical protein [Treponema sp.]
MKQWLSASELADIKGITTRGIRKQAAREGWEKRLFDGRGGKEYRYRLDGLPEDIRIAYVKSLNLDLEAVQSPLKPALKSDITPEVAHEITAYKGRSTADKPVKAWEECTEAEREIVRNRQKVITAFEQSGLNVRQFVESYRRDEFLPEVKARLGRWAKLEDQRRFYDSRLRPYRQFGLAWLVPQYSKKGAGARLSHEAKDRLK